MKRNSRRISLDAGYKKPISNRILKRSFYGDGVKCMQHLFCNLHLSYAADEYESMAHTQTQIINFTLANRLKCIRLRKFFREDVWSYIVYTTPDCWRQKKTMTENNLVIEIKYYTPIIR